MQLPGSFCECYALASASGGFTVVHSAIIARMMWFRLEFWIQIVVILCGCWSQLRSRIRDLVSGVWFARWLGAASNVLYLICLPFHFFRGFVFITTI